MNQQKFREGRRRRPSHVKRRYPGLARSVPLELETVAAPKDRDTEAAKARTRAAKRYATAPVADAA